MCPPLGPEGWSEDSADSWGWRDRPQGLSPSPRAQPCCRASRRAEPQPQPEAQAGGSRCCSTAARQGTPATSLTFPEPPSPQNESRSIYLMPATGIQGETDTGCMVLARDRSTRPWLRGTATPVHTLPSVAHVGHGSLTARTSLVPGPPQPRCGGAPAPSGLRPSLCHQSPTCRNCQEFEKHKGFGGDPGFQNQDSALCATGV